MCSFLGPVQVALVLHDHAQVGERAGHQLGVAELTDVGQVLAEPLRGQREVALVQRDHAEIAQDQRGPAQVTGPEKVSIAAR